MPAFVERDLWTVMLHDFQQEAEARLGKMNSPVRQRQIIRQAKKRAADRFRELRKADVGSLALKYWRQIVNETYGVFSLSRRFDSLVMWAHYSKNHAGFVLEFDANHTFFQQQKTDNKELGFLQTVTYSPERIQIEVPLLKAHPEISIRKSSDWSYEEEVRLIREFRNAVAKIGAGENAVHLFALPKDAIRSVTIGMYAESDIEQRIRTILNRDSDLRSVKLYKARLSVTNFSIERQLI